MEQLTNDYLTSESEFNINSETSGYLIETSKWAKFIVITFYVLFALVILILLAFGSYFLSRFGTYRRGIMEDSVAVAVIVIVVAALVVGVTYYFLLAFANKVRAGVETENIEQVNAGLGALKVHLIIIGVILMLGILLSLYGVSNIYR